MLKQAGKEDLSTNPIRPSPIRRMTSQLHLLKTAGKIDLRTNSIRPSQMRRIPSQALPKRVPSQSTAMTTGSWFRSLTLAPAKSTRITWKAVLSTKWSSRVSTSTRGKIRACMHTAEWFALHRVLRCKPASMFRWSIPALARCSKLKRSANLTVVIELRSDYVAYKHQRLVWWAAGPQLRAVCTN